jgi:hypothetical protein
MNSVLLVVQTVTGSRLFGNWWSISSSIVLGVFCISVFVAVIAKAVRRPLFRERMHHVWALSIAANLLVAYETVYLIKLVCRMFMKWYSTPSFFGCM